MTSTEEKVILAIGIPTDSLELLNNAVDSLAPLPLKLVQVSHVESDRKLLELIDPVSMIFMPWEGLTSLSFSALRRLQSKSDVTRGRLHMMYTPSEAIDEEAQEYDEDDIFAPVKNEILNDKQSRRMGISCWISSSATREEVATIIQNYLGFDEQESSKAKTPGSPSQKENPKTHPAPAITEDEEKTPKKRLFPQKLESKLTIDVILQTIDKIPRLSELEARPIAERMTLRSEEIANLKKKFEQSSKNTENPGIFTRVVIFHPDPSRALEIAKLIEGVSSLIVDAESITTDFLSALHRDVEAAIIWYDGIDTKSDLLLRYMAEERSLIIPVALLIPDQKILQKIKSNLAYFLFDSIIVFNRMQLSLNNALKSLMVSQNQSFSPRGLVNRLRRPFLKSSPPEYRKTVALSSAETIALQLKQKPGKEVWSEIEMVPYLLRANRLVEAIKVRQKILETWPDCYVAIRTIYHISLLKKYSRTHSDRNEESYSLYEKIGDPHVYIHSYLQRKSVPRQHFLDLVSLALSFDRIRDMQTILEHWMIQPQLGNDPEFFYFLGVFLRHFAKISQIDTERIPNPLSYFATALSFEPERIDFLSTYGEALVETSDMRHGLVILKQVSHSPLCPWSAKISLVRALKKSRQLLEAQSFIEQFLLEAPGNHELKSLSQGILPATS